MKLFTFCTGYKKEIYIKSWTATRPDLEKEKGEKLQLNCRHCGTNNQKHINDIHAK